MTTQFGLLTKEQEKYWSKQLNNACKVGAFESRFDITEEIAVSGCSLSFDRAKLGFGLDNRCRHSVLYNGLTMQEFNQRIHSCFHWMREQRNANT